ncbi:MAG: formylglycine-generating enzyme family protein [Verrucomicrobia bacterium]|nr:formylglycine-generating enzyme family protein [Verrucomicrobiota bacterium]
MKRRLQRMGLALGVWAVTGWLGTQLLAQQIAGLDFMPRLTIQSELGITNQIQYTNNLNSSNWAALATMVVTQSPYTFLDLSAPPAPQRFYRVVVLPPAGMVWIPAGTFTMGSPDSEAGRYSDEGPQTRVTLTRGFFLSQYHVTQGEYLSIIRSNPSYFPGDTNLPVEQVNWYDATNYCAQLTAPGRLPAGWAYRLPTEAEWEYSCRAGSTNRFFYGDDPGYTQLANHAWYRANSAGTTHRVGGKLPNRWGLYDMVGNVWEWCSDWYGAYPGGSVTDPQGSVSGMYRVQRGGSWNRDAYYCRSAQRYGYDPAYGYLNIGFRVVLARVQP